LNESECVFAKMSHLIGILLWELELMRRELREEAEEVKSETAAMRRSVEDWKFELACNRAEEAHEESMACLEMRLFFSRRRRC
jgi:hypothetical protein